MNVPETIRRTCQPKDRPYLLYRYESMRARPSRPGERAMLGWRVPSLYCSADLAEFGYLGNRLPKLSPPGMFLHGPMGRGKTRLAAALLRANVYSLGLSLVGCGSIEPHVRFATAPSFVRAYGDAMGGHQTAELFDEFVSYGLLVLDDVGMENRSPWATGLVSELVEARVASEGCTVLTTNLAPQDLVAYDSRLASRLLLFSSCEFLSSDRNWRLEPTRG